MGGTETHRAHIALDVLHVRVFITCRAREMFMRNYYTQLKMERSIIYNVEYYNYEVKYLGQIWCLIFYCVKEQNLIHIKF